MPTGSDPSTRRWLAISVVALSVIGVVLISAVVIFTASGADRKDASQLVFSSVLPLLGTWVGTVLAFYFARENLAAATASTLALQGREETAKLVNDVMIRAIDFIAYDLSAGQDVNKIPLADLRAAMSQVNPPSRRLPIRDPSGAVLYVVHDSTLTAFAEVAPAATTFGDLLADPTYKALVLAIGFVSDKATIADARREIDLIKDCNDVFVTQTGKPEDPAVGWLTNTQLAGIQ